MNKLLEKLDRAAAGWLNTIDAHLQAPIARALSGEVFMVEAPSMESPHEEQPVLPVAAPTAAPVRKTGASDLGTARPPVLRKADAVHKR